MLEHSFIHLPNFGPVKEKKIWESGVYEWDDYLERYSDSGHYRASCSIIASSRHALKTHDLGFFSEVLPSNEMWRAVPTCRKIAYLDIETTGTRPRDHITVIGVYDGKETKSYIYGKNLDEFRRDIGKFDMMVTFNGSLFDIPFIKREMAVRLPPLHVDLRFVLASLEVTGGLKKIEKKFGFERDDDLDGLNGYDAILLWRKYVRKKDLDALDVLVRYNSADVDNLKKLLSWAYDEKRKRTGFDEIHSKQLS